MGACLLTKADKGFRGINSAKVIKSFGQTYQSGMGTYTATEDCWVVGTTQGDFNYMKIDNIDIVNYYSHLAGRGFCIPLKKGQTFTVNSSANGAVTIYGVK